MKGLGFFRTRSAPPVPHEERDAVDLTSRQTSEGTPGGKTVRIGEVAHQDLKAVAREPMHSTVTPIQMPKPIRSPGRSPPSVILEQHSSFSSLESAIGVSAIGVSLGSVSSEGTPALLSLLEAEGKSKTAPISTTIEGASVPSSQGHPVLAGLGMTQPSFSVPGSAGAGVSGPHQQQPVSATHKVDKVPSRSTSPAPLEAILLDRKRRLAAAHVQTSSGGTPTGSIAPSPVPSLGGGGLRVADAIAATAGFSSGTPPLVTPVPSVVGGAGGGGGASAATGVPATGTAAAAIGRVGGGGPASKGTRFKSSPLGGGERAGVVIAEQLKAAYSSISRDGEASVEASGLNAKADDGKEA